MYCVCSAMCDNCKDLPLFIGLEDPKRFKRQLSIFPNSHLYCSLCKKIPFKVWSCLGLVDASKLNNFSRPKKSMAAMELTLALLSRCTDGKGGAR